MKFGLKLWSTNTDLIKQAVQSIETKVFDYIELFVIPDTKINPFVIDVPYIIHIPHEKFGVNVGDPSINKYNLEIIRESVSWADKLNAKYLILHAGYGSIENAIDIFHEIEDERLLIENMPKVGLNGEQMIGYSPVQIEQLIGDNNIGLCLDFGHAINAAASLGVDYKIYIKGFVDLFEPKMFHISDGLTDREMDTHLNIGEGNYDMNFIKNCISNNKNRYVTFETPRSNKHSIEDDLENYNIFISKSK